MFDILQQSGVAAMLSLLEVLLMLIVVAMFMTVHQQSVQALTFLMQWCLAGG